jgi:uncharacterized membrane protein YbaN (DUF454 family)
VLSDCRFDTFVVVIEEDRHADVAVRRTVAASHPVKRAAYLVLGLLFLGLALVGIVVPGLPTTINAIIAGFFFARSSERFDNWLTSHPVLGPPVLDHRNGIGFTTRAKTIAVSAITVSIGLSSWIIASSDAPSFVLAIMAVAWVYAVWYVLHQPTKPTVA